MSGGLIIKQREGAKMADKTKTIKTATDKELDELLIRLRKENEVQNLVGDLKRKSTVNGPFGNSISYERPEVSTEAPIESLYHNAEDVLAHFGILGMHWGHRKGDKGSEADRKVEVQASKNSTKNFVRAHNETINEMNSYITKMNSRWEPKFAGAPYWQKSPHWDAYMKDYRKGYENALNIFAKSDPGHNLKLSNNDILEQRYTVSGTNGVSVTLQKRSEAKHSALGIEDQQLDIFPEQEDNGKILPFKKITLNEDGEVADTLAHFGILGMHWGVRRGRKQTSPGKKSRNVSSEDYVNAKELNRKGPKALSTKELKELTTRLQLEKQYKDLTKKDLSAGRKWVKEVVGGAVKEQAKSQISKYIGRGLEEAVRRAAR